MAVEEHYARVQLSPEQRQAVRAFVVETLTDAKRTTQEEVSRQEGRIQQLIAERDKLLQAYYAGAVPLDQLKQEQGRIGQGLAEAERLLANCSADLAATRQRLDETLELIATVRPDTWRHPTRCGTYSTRLSSAHPRRRRGVGSRAERAVRHVAVDRRYQATSSI